MITSDDVEKAESDLYFLKQTYLQENGWKSRCVGIPGSFWVWEHAERKLMAGMDLAVEMTKNF